MPLPNVSAQILSKVIEYCKYHVEAEKGTDDKPAPPDDDIKSWDNEFVKVDQGTLFELILARTLFFLATHKSAPKIRCVAQPRQRAAGGKLP